MAMTGLSPAEAKQQIYDFYEEEYLTKNKVYVASLIDRINIDYNYLFKIDTNTTINFTYDVIGTLIIADNKGQNVFFEKDYVLVENVHSLMNNGVVKNIIEKVSIDYHYYNDLANKFRTNYGINTSSKLVVKLKINEKSMDDLLDLDNKSEMSLTIPLSEREVNINMLYEEVNKNSKVISKGRIVINNKYYIMISCIFLIISLIFLVKLLKLLSKVGGKQSNYDRYIRKILREYDRLIVNTKTPPDLNDKNVIRVNTFEELLDVRDNLKLPIKYYVVNEHEKSNFYISHHKEVYLLTVKAFEMEGKGNEK